MNDVLKEKIQLILVKNRINIILIMGAMGILLLSAEDLLPKDKKVISEEFTASQYQQEMEEQLESLLSMVNGAGKVKVMITLEGGKENIYAWQEKKSVDEKSNTASADDSFTKRETYENEIVMVTNGSEKTALIEKTMEPVVQGVVIVCQGADDIKVISDITNAETLDATLKWKKAIDENANFIDGGKLPCLLIQNKIDLVDEEEKQDEEEVRAFAQKNNYINVFRTSVKEGIGVDESMDYLIKVIVDRLDEYVSKTNKPIERDKTSLVIQQSKKDTTSLLAKKSCCSW
jgi:stage III sporulation protein AG